MKRNGVVVTLLAQGFEPAEQLSFKSDLVLMIKTDPISIAVI